ncbi:MAG: indolepyruvate oxidoreductase subunit beta family protein [Burkholderiales bacterium]|nr:indolepyruvate oxidoreductase subunit beta family protein [Burkholderiales bacterium]
MNPPRTLTLLIGALGGEGGGVLADWVVEAARAADYPVQATSIPGVAQRTGATTYYIELLAVRRAELGDKRPILCLAPMPGQVDVLLYSELAEAARAVQSGFVTGRTTLIASTHRVYMTLEKTGMADGRFDSDRAIAAARSAARRAILFDMEAETARAGTVISAVMFGALVGAGVLPLARADAENAIRAGGKGIEASLKGFAAGFARASEAPGTAETKPAQEKRPARPSAGDLAARVTREFPPEVHDVLGLGVARAQDFQDAAYAALYLDRVARVLAADRALGGGPGFMLTRETARFLALWMNYEDIARVADLKSRPERFDGIRAEAGIGQGEPIRVVEFFKPGYDELADLLPEGLARRVRAFARRRGRNAVFEDGIHVVSTSVLGVLQLRTLAAMKHLRRRSSRFASEQALIERWLAAIVAAPQGALAIEIALCGRLIKGYSDTHARAKENFTRILENLVESARIADAAERARAVRQAREAAQAAPEAGPLDRVLAPLGVTPRPPKAMPIRFHPRAAAQNSTSQRRPA